jgi:hypothetical protein
MAPDNASTANIPCPSNHKKASRAAAPVPTETNGMPNGQVRVHNTAPLETGSCR